MKIIIFVILTLFVNNFKASKPGTFLCGQGNDRGIHECKSTDECIKIWNNKKWKIGYIEVVDNNGECEASNVPTVCCKNVKYVAQTYAASPAEILRPPECNGTCVSPSMCKTPIPSNACSTTEVCCQEIATNTTDETRKETKEDIEGNDIEGPNQISTPNHCDGTCVPQSRCRTDINMSQTNQGQPDNRVCPEGMVCCKNKGSGNQSYPAPQCNCVPRSLCGSTIVPSSACGENKVLCCEYKTNIFGESDDNMQGPGPSQQVPSSPFLGSNFAENGVSYSQSGPYLWRCQNICVRTSKCKQIIPNFGCPVSYACCDAKDIVTANETPRPQLWPGVQCGCFPRNKCDTPPVQKNVCDNDNVMCCQYQKNSNDSNMAEGTNMGGNFGGYPGQTQQANSMECDGACIPGPKCNATTPSYIKCPRGGDVCCQFKDILNRGNQLKDSNKNCRCVPKIRCNDANPLYDVCDNREVLCCESPKGNSQGEEYKEGYMKGRCITDNGDLRECVPHYLCLDKRKQSSCNCELQELCCESPRFK